MTNDLEIFTFCEGEDLSGFFCTDGDLNDYVHNDAYQDMQKGYSVTHLVKKMDSDSYNMCLEPFIPNFFIL